uniref:Uncharacterized protein n=1 Tax=Branchiostoma floridae TaxID=7739 RepID=C3XST0_BRAFL|eukprot:XP_002612992.1 hypothetical protein BRAFLDRAFT_74782 [Branchiostoma floridae]
MEKHRSERSYSFGLPNLGTNLFSDFRVHVGTASTDNASTDLGHRVFSRTFAFVSGLRQQITPPPTLDTQIFSRTFAFTSGLRQQITPLPTLDTQIFSRTFAFTSGLRQQITPPSTHGRTNLFRTSKLRTRRDYASTDNPSTDLGHTNLFSDFRVHVGTASTDNASTDLGHTNLFSDFRVHVGTASTDNASIDSRSPAMDSETDSSLCDVCGSMFPTLFMLKQHMSVRHHRNVINSLAEPSYDAHLRQLLANLRQENMVVRNGILGDGNCQFAAFADQLKLLGKVRGSLTVKHVREMAVSYLRANRRLTLRDEYLTKIQPSWMSPRRDIGRPILLGHISETHFVSLGIDEKIQHRPSVTHSPEAPIHVLGDSTTDNWWEDSLYTHCLPEDVQTVSSFCGCLEIPTTPNIFNVLREEEQEILPYLNTTKHTTKKRGKRSKLCSRQPSYHLHIPSLEVSKSE